MTRKELLIGILNVSTVLMHLILMETDHEEIKIIGDFFLKFLINIVSKKNNIFFLQLKRKRLLLKKERKMKGGRS